MDSINPLLKKAMAKWYILMGLYMKGAGKTTKRKIKEGCLIMYLETFTVAIIMTANVMEQAKCITRRLKKYTTGSGLMIDDKAKAKF